MTVAVVPGWSCGFRMTVTDGIGDHSYTPAISGYLYIRRVNIAVTWAGTSPWGMTFDDGGGASPPVAWDRTSPWAGSTVATDETWKSPVWHPLDGGSSTPPSGAWTTFPSSPGTWVEPYNFSGGAYEGAVAVIGGNTYTLTGSFPYTGYNGYVDFIFSTSAPSAFTVATDDPCSAPPTPKITYTINGVDFDDLVEKRIRVELNDTGVGFMRIHRGHAQATAANLARGNIVSVTIPEIDPDPIFEWILESGDFDLISSDEEGGEILSFTGPGTLAILRRAIIPPISAISGAGALKLSKGIWEYTNGKAGSIIRRQIDEAQDRGILTEITRTFDDTNDSNGNPWNNLGHWQMPIGANLFDEVIRLCAAGLLNPEMGPGLQFNLLRARGFTHTGTSFGTNVVRFVKGVNIASELARAQGGRTYVSDEWVKGSNGTWRLVQASSPPFRAEGAIEVNSKDPDVMDDAGEAALGYAEDAQDAILLAHRVPWPGDGPDEGSGIYLPGQYWTANGNYWVGDLVTLHTGTGDFDFDNQTFRVFAITIGEDETGYLAPPIVELNAPWPERDRRDDGDGITPGAIAATGSSGGRSGGGTVNLTGVAYSDDLSWKQPVRVATTGNISISTALNAGDTIDGVTLVAGDRVLVKAQSTSSQNGIYQAGATPSRTSDFDDDDELVGAMVYVVAGTANGGKVFRSTNTTDPVVDSDAIVFDEFAPNVGDVLDLPTAETDTTLVLAPDGAGGVEFRAETGGGGSFATPAIGLGTAAAAGAAATVIRSDATIVAFDATAPSTQAIGDGASVGVAAVAARRDHKHAITNPLTTQDDLWIGGASGAPARLAKGSDGQVLTVDPTTHHLVWATPSSGFSNPMTTKGDIIVGDTGGSPIRKAVGTDGQVLTADAASTGGVKWAAAGGGGGGADANHPHPLDSYAIDGTYGDDFTAASLDTSRWTRRGFTSGAETPQVGPRGTYLRVSCSGRSSGDGYYQSAVSLPDGTYAAKLLIWGAVNNNFGIAVYDSSGSGVAASGIYSSPSTVLIMGVTTYTTYSGTFAAPLSNASMYGFLATEASPLWIYIRKSGTSWYTAHSFNGENWSPESGSITWSGTPNRMGLFLTPLGGIPSFVDVDWFNKIA